MPQENPHLTALLAKRGIKIDPTIEWAINSAFHNVRVGDLGANGGTIVGFYRDGSMTAEVTYDESKEGSDDALQTAWCHI